MNPVFYMPGEQQLGYVGVPQRGYAITSGSSNQHSLFTCHIATCFAVTLYDKETKIGVLAHIDITNSVKESIDKLSKNFTERGIDLSKLEVQIIGGYSSQPPCVEQLEHLELALNQLTQKITKLVFTKRLLIWFSEHFSQIILDTRTGVVSSTSEHMYLVKDPRECKDYTEKGQRIHQELVELFKETQQLLLSNQITGDEIEARFAKLQIPIKKVFDGTKTSSSSKE